MRPSDRKGKEKEDDCARAVLGQASGDFTIRLLVFGRDQVDRCNLGLFSFPEHPHFNDSKLLEKISCSHLTLDFDSVAERKKFNLHLKALFALRNTTEAERRQKIAEAKQRSDQPGSTLR